MNPYGYEQGSEWPYEPRPVYDHEAEGVFNEDELDELDPWLHEWFMMGMRELLHYLWKQAEFHRYLVETGRV